MTEQDKVFDTILKDELRRLNTHLPKNRKTLGELLSENAPSVGAVSGELIMMKKSEVEELAAELPDTLKDKFMLPLVVLRRRDLGPGAFTVLGDRYEEYALSKLLNEYKGTFAEFKQSTQSSTVFYKPQLSELLRRFHSLVVIGFGLSE